LYDNKTRVPASAGFHDMWAEDLDPFFSKFAENEDAWTRVSFADFLCSSIRDRRAHSHLSTDFHSSRPPTAASSFGLFATLRLRRSSPSWTFECRPLTRELSSPLQIDIPDNLPRRCLINQLIRPKPTSLDFIAIYTSVFSPPSVFSVGIQIRTGDQSLVRPSRNRFETLLTSLQPLTRSRRIQISSTPSLDTPTFSSAPSRSPRPTLILRKRSSGISSRTQFTFERRRSRPFQTARSSFPASILSISS
jgi:hypothetical protein